VIPGTGRMEGFTYCPYCKTAIHYNQHPAEKRASTIISIAVTLVAITMATQNRTLIDIGIVILTLAIVTSLYIVFRADLRNAPRWILHEQSNDSLDC
jgi:hypothetical protein